MHDIDGDGGLEHLGVPGGRRRRQRGGDGEEGEDDDEDALGRRHLHEERLWWFFLCWLMFVIAGRQLVCLYRGYRMQIESV